MISLIRRCNSWAGGSLVGSDLVDYFNIILKLKKNNGTI